MKNILFFKLGLMGKDLEEKLVTFKANQLYSVRGRGRNGQNVYRNTSPSHG
jgi:hypothetical protein